MEHIVSKVQKLLRLSTANSNAEEAASAAAKAQQLINEHNLSAAMLAIEGSEPVPDEPIVNFSDAPLHAAPILKRWRGQLAMTIAKHNGCMVWRRAGNLMIVGRPSDAETVRYLFAWLERETERLTHASGAGRGTTWRDNFRIGVVEAIAEKLKAQHASFTRQARVDNPHALVKVDQALARIEARTTSVERWTKEHLKLRAGSSCRSTYDKTAREMGRAAGRSINVGTRRGLTSGAERLM